MKVRLADLWFVVDGNDLCSLPDEAYTTQREAQTAAARLNQSTADFRARLSPKAPLAMVRRFDDIWLLVRDNVRDDAAI
jgi:hypothetical protein